MMMLNQGRIGSSLLNLDDYQPIRKPWFDLSGFYETADGCQVKSIPSMYIF